MVCGPINAAGIDWDGSSSGTFVAWGVLRKKMRIRCGPGIRR